jgi:hypothetical protein
VGIQDCKENISEKTQLRWGFRTARKISLRDFSGDPSGRKMAAQ